MQRTHLHDSMKRNNMQKILHGHLRAYRCIDSIYAKQTNFQKSSDTASLKLTNEVDYSFIFFYAPVCC